MKVNVKPYEKVLVALDIYSSYEPVLNRALGLVDNASSLDLVYVTLPHAYFEPYAVDVGRDFIGDIQSKSKTRLEDIAKTHSIPEENIHSLIGNAADEIHELAEDRGVDLIVIGTHGQSGLKLLLGSTANAVLHGAKCDVLAVRV